MAYPKIIYNSVTLTFTYPPVMKPGTDDREADRTDTLSTSGKQQSVYLRTDVFKNLQMDYVPASDIAAWESFIEWAEQGKAFDYYPDASSGTHASYTLVDTKWNPKYNFRNMAKFTLRLRLAV